MQQLPDGAQYRVLGRPIRQALWQAQGRPDPGDEAIAIELNLEDGYIWLMNRARVASYGGER